MQKDDSLSRQRGTFANASECARSLRCYPAHIHVRDLSLEVVAGVTNSFFVDAAFRHDTFHVAVTGPEIAQTSVQSIGNGTYRISYCVDLPGYYPCSSQRADQQVYVHI